MENFDVTLAILGLVVDFAAMLLPVLKYRIPTKRQKKVHPDRPNRKTKVKREIELKISISFSKKG